MSRGKIILAVVLAFVVAIAIAQYAASKDYQACLEVVRSMKIEKGAVVGPQCQRGIFKGGKYVGR